MCRSFPLGLFTQHLFQGKWKAWELWEPLMQGKKLFTRHKIASKYWICHPLYPVMVWASRALFHSRFWVLALPKSGVVVVLSSNTAIGVKVVLDFFLFFFWGGGGVWDLPPIIRSCQGLGCWRLNHSIPDV